MFFNYFKSNNFKIKSNENKAKSGIWQVFKYIYIYTYIYLCIGIEESELKPRRNEDRDYIVSARYFITDVIWV